MQDSIWETFDALFRTARKQSLHIESLEARVCELERELRDLKAEMTRRAFRVVEPETAERAS